MKWIYVFAVFFLLTGCGDIIQSDASDLKKYPWVDIFVFKGSNFSKVKTNIDIGSVCFSFASHDPSDEYFSIIDELALKRGWIITGTSRDSRIFECPSTAYPAAKGKDIVSIKYEDNGRITLIYRSNIMPD